MNTLDFEIEPERYELFEAVEHLETTRREFFRIAGGGVIIALLMGDEADAQQRGGRPAGPPEVGAWIQRNNLLHSPPFHVDRFGLYSSWQTKEGSVYRLEREYPLKG